MKSTYYVNTIEGEKGPFTLEEIRVAVKIGVVTETTAIAIGDVGNWSMAKTIPGLFNSESNSIRNLPPTLMMPVSRRGGVKENTLPVPVITLYEAIEKDKIEQVWLHIAARRTSLDKENDKGVVPLIQTLCYNPPRLEIIKLLIRSGADVDIDGDYGKTPLHIAATKDYVDACKILIRAGADVNAKDDLGFTPLHWVMYNKSSLEVCKILVEFGANVNAKDNLGQTPLYAVSSARICKFLVKVGSDVRTKREDGNTPLHNAAEKGYADVCKILMRAGASVKIQNCQCQTPFDIAKDDEIKEILEN